MIMKSVQSIFSALNSTAEGVEELASTGKFLFKATRVQTESFAKTTEIKVEYKEKSLLKQLEEEFNSPSTQEVSTEEVLEAVNA